MTTYPARYRPPAGYLRRYRPGRRSIGGGSRTEMITGLAIGTVLFAGVGGGTAVTVTRHHAAPAQAAPPQAPSAGPASPSGNAALGQRLASAYGWGTDPEWTCLNDLWTRESGWQNYVINKQSGAFGVAQALTHGAAPATPPVITFPGGGSEHGVTVNQYGGYGLSTAQARAANSGDATDQIKWGLGYIQSTYGTPCSAWQHETAAGWY